MPFDNFDNIQQNTPNSCGAFALAACLDNFGGGNQTHGANRLNTADLSLGYSAAGAQVTNVGGALAFAQSIYEITGNLTLNLINATATYAYANPVSDMNPPSALVYIATLFGFAPNRIVVRYNNNGLALFSALNVTNHNAWGTLLNTEVELLQLISNGGGMGIVGPVNYANTPAPNQVQMVVVNDGQHWLALNETELYDPGTGYVGAYQLVTLNGIQFFSYTMNQVQHNNAFSGVWIQLTHQ